MIVRMEAGGWPKKAGVEQAITLPIIDILARPQEGAEAAG